MEFTPGFNIMPHVTTVALVAKNMLSNRVDSYEASYNMETRITLWLVRCKIFLFTSLETQLMNKNVRNHQPWRNLYVRPITSHNEKTNFDDNFNAQPALWVNNGWDVGHSAPKHVTTSIYLAWSRRVVAVVSVLEIQYGMVSGVSPPLNACATTEDACIGPVKRLQRTATRGMLRFTLKITDIRNFIFNEILAKRVIV